VRRDQTGTQSSPAAISPADLPTTPGDIELASFQIYCSSAGTQPELPQAMFARILSTVLEQIQRIGS
jgi:hypothetical protein